MAYQEGKVRNPRTGSDRDVRWDPKTNEVWVKVHHTFTSEWKKLPYKVKSFGAALSAAEEWLKSNG